LGELEQEKRLVWIGTKGGGGDLRRVRRRRRGGGTVVTLLMVLIVCFLLMLRLSVGEDEGEGAGKSAI